VFFFFVCWKRTKIYLDKDAGMSNTHQLVTLEGILTQYWESFTNEWAVGWGTIDSKCLIQLVSRQYCRSFSNHPWGNSECRKHHSHGRHSNLIRLRHFIHFLFGALKRKNTNLKF
jgi:hypothetical protein